MSKPFSVAVDQSWVDAGKEAAQREYSKVLSAAKTEGPDAARRASQRRLDSVLASSAALDATPVACKAGCTYCCHIRVVAQPAEVVGLVDYLRKMLSKERFAAFDARVRDAAERVKSMSRDEHIKSNLACPVLVDGRCAGSCPWEWCRSGEVITAISGEGRVGQAARIGRLTRGSSPMAETLSRVM